MRTHAITVKVTEHSAAEAGMRADNAHRGDDCPCMTRRGSSRPWRASV